MGLFKTMQVMYRLTRFEHAIMIMVAVLVGEIVVLGHAPRLDVFLGITLLVPMLIEVGSFSLNDYLDRESDRINKRTDRPLVTGEISEEGAVQVSFIAFFAAVLLATFLPNIAMWIAWIFGILAIVYNLKLKDTPLMGNLFIAFSMGIPFIYGNFIYSDMLKPVNIVLFAIAIVIGIGREILKSVEDMKGDLEARGARTLPVVIGIKNSLRISKLLLTLFVLISLYPFFTELKLSMLSGLFLLTAEALIILSITIIKDEPISLKKVRKYTLIVMFLGTLAILLSVVGL